MASTASAAPTSPGCWDRLLGPGMWYGYTAWSLQTELMIVRTMFSHYWLVRSSFPSTLAQCSQNKTGLQVFIKASRCRDGRKRSNEIIICAPQYQYQYTRERYHWAVVYHRLSLAMNNTRNASMVPWCVRTPWQRKTKQNHKSTYEKKKGK